MANPRGRPKNNTFKPEKKVHEYYVPPRNEYGRSNVQPLWSLTPKDSTTQKYSNDTIVTFLNNPYQNYKKLQNVSNYFLYNSAIYNNFLDYLSNVFSWDYILYCEGSDEANGVTAKNRYINSAQLIKKINVKSLFPSMLKRVLANGECYFYNISDSSNSIIVEIDSSICKLAYIDSDGLWRYYIDATQIDANRAYEYPDEIYNFYKQWVNGGKQRNKIVVDGIEIPQYLHLVSNKGFAIFSHMKKTQHDYPYLASMFCDLNNLESDKAYMSEYIRESNTKLVHMKVPTNKDTGEPLMEKDTVGAYHDSAKSHLPRNVAPLTNPFEVNAINLDTAQDRVLNAVEHSTKVVMQDGGISESIFNATTTLGLEYSTLADASKLFPLLYFFENFINSLIKNWKCKVVFLRDTIFNQLDWNERYYANLQAGGSRSLFVATSGLEPYDFLNLAKTEQVLGIDELLEPKLNSSQMNQSDLDAKNGAPKKKPKDASDSTNKVNETK
jgi:hypothetical protein